MIFLEDQTCLSGKSTGVISSYFSLICIEKSKRSNWLSGGLVGGAPLSDHAVAAISRTRGSSCICTRPDLGKPGENNH